MEGGSANRGPRSHLPRESSQGPRRNTELDVLFDADAVRKEVSTWRRLTDFFFGWTLVKASYFNTICGLCLAQPRNETELRQFRKSGYHRLNAFIGRLNRREVRLLDIQMVIWCCLNLVSHFQDRYRDSRGCNHLKMKRKLSGSRDLLCHVLELEMPQRQKKVVRSCILYFTVTWQWDFEDVVLFVFENLLLMATAQEIVLSRLIKAIEVCQREGRTNQAHKIAASLSLILENLYLEMYQFTVKLHRCFNAMLKLYLLNDLDTSRSTQVRSANIKFRIQIKNCIRHFISKIRDSRGLVSVADSMAEIMLDPEIPEEEQMDLIEMIAYCAQKQKRPLYRESITPRLLRFLLAYLKSDYRSTAMASLRIFHYFLDRHENLKHFTEPIYHFKGRSNIVVNFEYSREDVHFFKSFSEDFFAGMYRCLNRYTETTNLVSSYAAICLVLVEVPDPITTINMIRVVIKTQNNVLRHGDDFARVTRFHIHAVVAAVLSLICLIHQEEVTALGRYVQEVVTYRNENSPHLLPPLSPQYSIAKHHTTDYHRQLYFLEEEVLYALKQCWLGRRRSN